jgi:predicted secreted hydrolase
MGRRLRAMAAALLMLARPSWAQGPVTPQRPFYAPVLPHQPLRFPADHGAHPDFRTEWWYVTGWLDTPTGPEGFQVTFFRTRPQTDPRNPSAFAPKQVLFAHAALSDPRIGKLLHEERISREGFGLAQASTDDTDIVLQDWSLKRSPDGRFAAKAGGGTFGLDLTFTPTQPVLLEGDDGFSQKGPLAAQASHYYSLPHLAVSGQVRRNGRAIEVRGEAWLDREWSSSYLDPRAVGWDWTGLNLDDGGALMAFQIRDASGHALWAGGSLRRADGRVVRFKPADVAFKTRRRWRSPRTGADYPVERELTLALPEGPRRFSLSPLFDDQELDSRAGGGPVYWEGAVRTQGGRGYLELTGYVTPLKL